MKITIRTPQMQDYDRFSAIMDQVQQMHVDWRPDVYKPVSYTHLTLPTIA